MQWKKIVNTMTMSYSKDSIDIFTKIWMIRNVQPYLTLPYRSVVSCARLTTSPCHLFLSSAALFSW